MSRTSRYAFILAKVYGMVAKSFVGSAYRDLLRLKWLAELSDRLFPGERAGAPAAAAPREVEARIVRASIDSVIAVLDYLRDPPQLLVHAARKAEYQTAKALARSLAHGGGRHPRVGPRQVLRLSDQGRQGSCAAARCPRKSSRRRKRRERISFSWADWRRRRSCGTR